jgi:endonuclease YncB( thermonuclease family)
VSTKTFLAPLALLLLANPLFGQEPVIRARCVGVTDGDTVKVLTADQQLLRIRLAWIDSPEMGQAFGYRAKQAMSELVFGKEVVSCRVAIRRRPSTKASVSGKGAFRRVSMPIQSE